MKEGLTFNDVLIQPRFSTINSRKDVNLTPPIPRTKYQLGVMAANMDTICGADMAIALGKSGAIPGVIHRFMNIEDNVKEAIKVKEAGFNPWVSVGIGKEEFKRYKALVDQGCYWVVIDVAHAAQKQVTDWYDEYKQYNSNNYLVVGNFATSESYIDFQRNLGYLPDCIKINIGAGSMCTTRLKTGIGVPQLTALMDCDTIGIPMIADGAMNNPADFAKAFAIKNVIACMTGSMFAGCLETPGEIITETKGYISETGFSEIPTGDKYKSYRGSASKESYEDQGKTQSYITTEGETTLVPFKGPIADVLTDIEGGLRSSLTYTNSRNLTEFKENTEFIKITQNGWQESKPYGSTQK